MRRDAFATYHPIVNFVYFVAVMCISMFVMHPVILGISLCGAVTYSVYLKGERAWKFNIIMLVPTLLVMALINPAFNHRGQTILTYIGGNPITLESIVYGLVAAAMLVSVILWFSCYNSVMTSDKFIYLFGKIIPAMSLIFSMCLRFVPRFRVQLSVVVNAQKCIGKDVGTGSILQRIKNSLEIVSIMTAWALENSVETADSMKARGYGLRGRTAFSNYRLQWRDCVAMGVMLCAITAVIISLITKAVYSSYIPRILLNELDFMSVFAYVAYLGLCLLPMTINIYEDNRWNSLQSKI